MEEFLAANALPGPGSKVYCILQDQGLYGATRTCTYEKITALSHIPGLSYKYGPLNNAPRTKELTSWALKDGVLASILLKKSSLQTIGEATELQLRYEAS